MATSLKTPIVHKGERPRNSFFHGRNSIFVRLLDYPDETFAIRTMFYMLAATWGEHSVADNSKNISQPEMAEVVRSALKGGMLGNALESAKFTFAFDNISRATTHQIVRSRVGVAFAQQGGRNNDWRHHTVRVPETIGRHPELVKQFYAAIQHVKEVYAEAIDKYDVPFQDARYILPIGSTTYLIATYDYRALQDFLKKRLCLNMGWEIVTCAWLMREAVQKVCPILAEGLLMPCEIHKECGFVKFDDLFEGCGYQPLPPGEWKGYYNKNQNGSLLPDPIYEEIKRHKK
jgi:flavin-dependent thymidylate synthase